MRFQIVGANAESGDDVDVMLEAPSQAEVERIAHDKGILVTSIRPALGNAVPGNPLPGNGHAAGQGAPAAAAVAHAPAPGAAPKPVDDGAISLVPDDTPVTGTTGAAIGGHAPAAAHPPEAKHGSITVNANSPSETAHTGEGHIPEEQKGGGAMEYHILMNQALYLLETAVNKYLKDGWEPQGGLTVGTSNNAMQYFQALVRKKKH